MTKAREGFLYSQPCSSCNGTGKTKTDAWKKFEDDVQLWVNGLTMNHPEKPGERITTCLTCHGDGNQIIVMETNIIGIVDTFGTRILKLEQAVAGLQKEKKEKKQKGSTS